MDCSALLVEFLGNSLTHQYRSRRWSETIPPHQQSAGMTMFSWRNLGAIPRKALPNVLLYTLVKTIGIASGRTVPGLQMDERMMDGLKLRLPRKSKTTMSVTHVGQSMHFQEVQLRCDICLPQWHDGFTIGGHKSINNFLPERRIKMRKYQRVIVSVLWFQPSFATAHSFIAFSSFFSSPMLSDISSCFG